MGERQVADPGSGYSVDDEAAIIEAVSRWVDQEVRPVARHFDDVNPHTEAQLRAIEEVQRIADELRLDIEFEQGDMQFVNNHALLHDRTGFEDWPDPGRKRHLFRLWLSMADDRPLPEVFATRFGSVQVGDRGGIVPAAST